MSLFFRARKRAHASLVLAMCISASVVPVAAQIAAPPASLSIADAFQLALSQQPWALATSERQREQVSRETLADSWLTDSPSIASGLKTGNRDGLREVVVEISAPIATASRRALQVSSVRGEAAVYAATTAERALKLAGEVRDAYWAVQLATVDLGVAEDEINRALQLATDSARRTAAGDSARVDTLQAELSVQTLQSMRIEAEQRLNATRQGLRALIGDVANRGLVDAGETRDTEPKRALNNHPSLRLADQSTQLARTKLNEASALMNAAPTLSFALANERSNSGGNASTARVGVSFPFGGARRATPRIAQASAELTEAQASAPLLRRQLEAEAATAQALVLSAEQRMDALAQRERLAREVAQLFGKAYRLGERDLPTLLRAEGERAQATLALNRARIELKHAVSRVNQSLGLLP
jgi:outer membrane protein, heavy metal efflux system